MPVMNGLEASQIIRSSNTTYKDIPIITMTAYALSGDKENFLNAGMTAYISKPIDRERFLATLRGLLLLE